MMRGSFITGIALVFVAVGCTSEEDYYQVMREQRQAMKEVADILEKVHDEKSMAEATAALDQHAKKFEAISKKAKALPNPPPPEVVKRMQEDRRGMEHGIERLRTEVDRVGKLPGGKAFLKQFASDSSGLFEAIQP